MRAEARFTAGLPDRLQPRVQLRSGEYSAVLLGPTQVGKTSLVLDVLGCRSQGRTEVDTVLRAGRALGMSSTSTATTYRWADDADLWTMTVGEEMNVGTSADMMRILSSLRSDDGRLVRPGDVVQLWIPRKYHSDANRPALPVLLDLPGLFVDQDHERTQAKEVARSMVSMANVVILLVNAAQMTPLTRIGRESIPEVATWAFHPEKFRVVLTHAFSQGSLKESLFPGMTVHEWRQTVLNELASTSPMVRRACEDAARAGAVLESVFPVEMGASMADLLREDPDAGAVASELNRQLMEEFVASLDAAAALDAVYLSMPRATHIVRDRAREALRGRTRRLEDALESEKRAAYNVQRGAEILEKAHRTLERAEAMNSWTTSLRDGVVTMPWDNTTPAPADRSDHALQEHYANTLAAADDAIGTAFRLWFEKDAARNLVVAVGVPMPQAPRVSTMVARGINCDTICARLGTKLHCHRAIVKAGSSSDCLSRQRRGFIGAEDSAYETLTSVIQDWLSRVTASERFLSLEQATKDVAGKAEALRRNELLLHRERSAVADREAKRAAAAHDYREVELEASRLDRYLDEELSAQLSELEASCGSMDADDLLAAALLYLLMLKGRERMGRTFV
jgi:hypothetical protein